MRTSFRVLLWVSARAPLQISLRAPPQTVSSIASSIANLIASLPCWTHCLDDPASLSPKNDRFWFTAEHNVKLLISISKWVQLALIVIYNLQFVNWVKLHSMDSPGIVQCVQFEVQLYNLLAQILCQLFSCQTELINSSLWWSDRRIRAVFNPSDPLDSRRSCNFRVAAFELQLSSCSFRVAVLEPERYSVHYSGRFRHRMIRISYCSVRSLEFQFVIATLKGFQALDPIHRLLV